MAKKIYQEKQQYDDWFVIVLLALAILALLYAAVSYFWRTDVTALYSLVCLVLAAGLGYAIWWLTSLRAKLTVTDKKIKFQVKGPIQTSQKIVWEDIKSCTVVKAPKLVKWDRPKVTETDEKFYSLEGRNGLMIETKQGAHYFIGCQNVGELEEALHSQGKVWEVIIGS